MAKQIKYAAILAAGKGARLDILDTPKPIIKIGNKPLISWNIEMLAAAGIRKIFIVIGHRAREIQREIILSNNLPVEIFFIEQANSSKEGAWHSLVAFKDIIDDDFILTMSDTIFENSPYHSLLETELQAAEVLSVIDANKLRSEKSGANSRVKIEGSLITDVGLNLENHDGLETGIYLMGKDSLSQISLLDVGQNKGLSEIFDRLAKRRLLKPVLLGGGEWFDVNTPAVQVRAEMLARKMETGDRKMVTAKTLPEAKVFSNFFRDKTMSTNIVIERGLVANIGNIKIVPDENANSRHFLLVDSVVDKLYGDTVLNGLKSAGYDMVKIVVPAGESFKNINKYAELADQIFSYGMDKKSIIFSLGGGVINNIAGLLASTLYRGIGLVHLPTSLMAQLDAAIDFKQAIDSSKGKNLIGSYYPASAIYIDAEVLSTLDDRQIRNGISEAIKHALVQDEDFLRYLLENANNFRDSVFLEKTIKESVRLKVPLLNGYVGDDYNEMLPQYGHSIGHAVEHLSAYEFLHGEAIAIGMCVCAEIGRLMGICNQEVVDRHYEVFEKYHLPTRVPPEMSAEDILRTIRFDKHFVDGAPHMAIVEDVGKVWQNNGVYGAPINLKILEKAIEANQARLKSKPKESTKKVIVTGGSKGIGRAITEELLKSAYSVHVCARSIEELHRTKEELSRFGQIDFSVLDLSRREDVENFCAKWSEPIYGIVNNAGICKTERIDQNKDVWDEVINTNLSGLYFLTKGLSEKIVDRGRVVNISSQLGKIGRAGYGAYCASKFGVLGLTECWAKELGKRGINVNAVCPGWVNTEMSRVDMERLSKEKNISVSEYQKMICAPLELERFTEPEEVAKLVRFLVSEDSSGITGRCYLMHTLWNAE